MVKFLLQLESSYKVKISYLATYKQVLGSSIELGIKIISDKIVLVNHFCPHESKYENNWKEKCYCSIFQQDTLHVGSDIVLHCKNFLLSAKNGGYT